MQLNLLLAQGHRPEGIIFYDGYNDGYQYCGKQIMQYPGHLWQIEFTERIRNYVQLKKEYEQKIENIRIVNYVNFKAEAYLSRIKQIFKKRELQKEPIEINASLDK